MYHPTLGLRVIKKKKKIHICWPREKCETKSGKVDHAGTKSSVIKKKKKGGCSADHLLSVRPA